MQERHWLDEFITKHLIDSKYVDYEFSEDQMRQIIEEAMRRGEEKGKREALEEMKNKVMWWHPCRKSSVIQYLKRQLSSLSQSSNEEV